MIEYLRLVLLPPSSLAPPPQLWWVWSALGVDEVAGVQRAAGFWGVAVVRRGAGSLSAAHLMVLRVHSHRDSHLLENLQTILITYSEYSGTSLKGHSEIRTPLY